MYSAKTNDINVSVMPVYIDERSDPAASEYFWAYRVLIENHGELQVRLLSRYWKITDGNGLVEEVEGPGVVGKMPIIQAGESFEYTSGCPLNTPTGIMQGHYVMVDTNGNQFNVTIPAFSLDLPDITPTYN